MSNRTSKPGEETTPSNFIRTIIDDDLRAGKHGGKVSTRFPPEPNGYLHIGHAKSICLNFGIANSYPGGRCFLRFDDTNPLKEDTEYVESIKRDVEWLGFTWSELRFASDYFEQFYNYARELIRLGKAYVCELTAEETRQYRGTLTEPGKESPFRQRSVEENLDLFARMRAGEFADGSRVLRAKIDMNSGNINMRDPTVYRIRKAHHHRTGDSWCIYPMYDFAHCLSDYIEGITHSICTLEFQDHRPLYDWFLAALTPEPRPHQYEFARLSLNYTVTSKRRLKALLDEHHVSAWNDPRMPTIAGLRRRGFTPEAIRTFCERIGVAKKETVIDMSILEDCLRDDLNQHAKRAMCVLQPLKVVIDNYPADRTEELQVPNHPQDPSLGKRPLPFSRELYIEQDDFMEDPPAKYFRLSPGQEVRLRYSYVIKCVEAIKDAQGKVTELRCSYDPDTLGKNPVGRKVKGIIHWVDAPSSKAAEVRLYDRLFNHPNPAGQEKDGSDFRSFLNPASLEVVGDARIEASLANAQSSDQFQFERLGYFSLDTDSQPGKPVFNRSVTLRDSWSKEAP